MWNINIYTTSLGKTNIFLCLDQFNPCHSMTTQILYYTSNDILVDQVAFYTFIFQNTINILLNLLYNLHVSSTSTLKSKN